MLRRNVLVGLVIAAAAVLAAYWWTSPIIVLHLMQRAGARGDTEALSAHVDYPALRESLKGQFSASMAGKIGEPNDNPLSALGTMIGMAFVNQLIDVMARPQTLASALQTGRVRPGAASPPDEQNRAEWDLERVDPDRVVFHPHRPGEAADAKAAAFVFVRHGFADWKLSEIRMQLEK
jgi:hypothetical protein